MEIVKVWPKMIEELYAIPEVQICVEESLIWVNIPIHPKPHEIYSIYKGILKRGTIKNHWIEIKKKPNRKGRNSPCSTCHFTKRIFGIHMCMIPRKFKASFTDNFMRRDATKQTTVRLSNITWKSWRRMISWMNTWSLKRTIYIIRLTMLPRVRIKPHQTR